MKHSLRHSDIDIILNTGELCVSTYALRIHRKLKSLRYPRFSVIVPKYIGPAVVRNYVKRKIRAAFALISSEKNYDLVILVRKGGADCHLETYIKQLKKAYEPTIKKHS
ncbi:MAG: ribonuclease P protein component [Candidatus Babeliales bacterium]